jgi:polyisoprenoid-binding protein YceI
MHKEILESAQYSEIVFHPDRVEGSVAPQGQSTVQVHGTFSMHGGNHEITIPVQVEMDSHRWSASARFSVPYVKWGLKNPSTFVLHVKDTVEVEIHSSGLIK